MHPPKKTTKVTKGKVTIKSSKPAVLKTKAKAKSTEPKIKKTSLKQEEIDPIKEAEKNAKIISKKKVLEDQKTLK